MEARWNNRDVYIQLYFRICNRYFLFPRSSFFPSTGRSRSKVGGMLGGKLCILVLGHILNLFIGLDPVLYLLVLLLDRLSGKEWWTSCSIQIVVIQISYNQKKVNCLNILQNIVFRVFVGFGINILKIYSYTFTFEIFGYSGFSF